MAKVGCLVMIVGMVALFAIVVIPVLPFLETSPEIDNFLAPLICGPNERIEREQYSTTDREGTSYSMNVNCVDLENQSRDATGRWVLVGIVGFTVPLVVGLFAFIFGVNRFVAKRKNQFVSGIPLSMSGQPFSITFGPDDDKSLTERLQELQQAYDSRLISKEEFDRLRQEVLDSVS
jgi:hypothetical protein